MKSHRKLTQVVRAESDKGNGLFEKSYVKSTVVTSRGQKLNSLMDRLHGEIEVQIAAFMISSFGPLPGSVRNDGRALVKKGVVHPQLVESPLHPILKRLARDRLNHRR